MIIIKEEAKTDKVLQELNINNNLCINAETSFVVILILMKSLQNYVKKEQLIIMIVYVGLALINLHNRKINY